MSLPLVVTGAPPLSPGSRDRGTHVASLGGAHHIGPLSTGATDSREPPAPRKVPGPRSRAWDPHWPTWRGRGPESFSI